MPLEWSRTVAPYFGALIIGCLLEYGVSSWFSNAHDHKSWHLVSMQGVKSIKNVQYMQNMNIMSQQELLPPTEGTVSSEVKEVKLEKNSKATETREKSPHDTMYHRVDDPHPIYRFYHPLDIKFQHTAYIGTPDHPTIDGGLVNSADGIPINREVPQENVQKSIDVPLPSPKKNNRGVSPLSPTASTVNSPVTPPKASSFMELPMSSSSSPLKEPFSDRWVTSGELDLAIQRAARTGKLNQVLSQSQAKGLPAGVALVPLVESGYKSSAFSPKGAAGDWQLMPETAKAYGLDPDKRFDFEASTPIALNLLKDLHKQFGSWELAFAAYNAGSGRVAAALIRNPQATSIDDLNLPEETKQYVHRIMESSEIWIAKIKSLSDGGL
jgi:hypothetical protein